jgi:hypothetical protein
MNIIENLTLVEGYFSFDESKEILNSIFSFKITFHNMKSGVRKNDLEKTMQLHKKEFLP